MEQDDLYNSEEEEALELKLIDTHCHPHDDDRKHKKIGTLKTERVCIMGVRESDWGTVLKVYYLILHISSVVKSSVSQQSYRSSWSSSLVLSQLD